MWLVVCHKVQYWVLYFSFYISMISTTLHKYWTFICLLTTLNFFLQITELVTLSTWLCANKLSLNIDKTNFVIFHHPQKKIRHSLKIRIYDKIIKHVNSKFLGIMIDSNLNWKHHIYEVSKKCSINIGILSKLRGRLHGRRVTLLEGALS